MLICGWNFSILPIHLGMKIFKRKQGGRFEAPISYVPTYQAQGRKPGQSHHLFFDVTNGTPMHFSKQPRIFIEDGRSSTHPQWLVMDVITNSMEYLTRWKRRPAKETVQFHVLELACSVYACRSGSARARVPYALCKSLMMHTLLNIHDPLHSTF